MLLRLALAGLRGARLVHALNVSVLAIGIFLVTFLNLLGGALTERAARDAGHIDIVVGAKGSPLQLVLAAVFHVDAPAGNIPLAEVAALAADPLVAHAVPLALGDAARGFRIVGTTPAFLDLYGAKLASGRIFAAPLQAVLGADAASALHLELGQHFTGSHGLAGEGPEHHESPYTITGVLARTGTVVDRLVLTPMESVWEVHEGHGGASAREVTAVLIVARTPLAQISLPYRIQRATNYTAAVPAREWARLLALLGVGFTAVRALGFLVMACALLGMLAALLLRLGERRREFATWRLLGATPGQVLVIAGLEAGLLALGGAALGIALAHAAAAALAAWGGTGSALAALSAGLRPSEAWVLAASGLTALLAAAVAAAIAARADASRDLLGESG